MGAECLAHTAAVGGLDHRVDVDLVEGHVADELEAHHHHARDPQEDDLARRGEQVGRVEVLEVAGLVGPAPGGKGPERRAEPGVEHVGLAAQGRAAATRAALRLLLGDDRLGTALGFAVPHRELMAPPELPRDAPGPQVLHPVDVDPAPAFGHEAHAAVAHHLGGRLLELVHAHEPLQRDERLDVGAATLAGGHAVSVVLDLLEHAGRPQVGGDALTRLVDREPGVGPALGRDAAVGADGLDGRQLVVAADVEVGEIVGRSDLEGAGAEFGVDALVGDHRQAAPEQRQHGGAVDQRGVAGVAGVHGHGGVAQHRLGPRRGDRQRAAALELVAHVVQVTRLVDVLHLEVADRRAATRTPVDDVVVFVDVTLRVQGHEDLGHRPHVAGVEGKALALVVAGAAQAPYLRDDGAAILAAPLPDALDELVAAEVFFAQSLAAQQLFDHVLGGDAGVVCAQQPAGVVAQHAVVAGQGILDGIVQSVAHV
jgi:hypothetical protein